VRNELLERRRPVDPDRAEGTRVRAPADSHRRGASQCHTANGLQLVLRQQWAYLLHRQHGSLPEYSTQPDQNHEGAPRVGHS